MTLFKLQDDRKISIRTDYSDTPKYQLLLAHGAGAGMNHSFLEQIAGNLSKMNASVTRFNFPYMEEGRRSPGSPKKNVMVFSDVLEHIKNQDPALPVVLSGKSYGGRIASHWVSESSKKSLVSAIVYLGFPLHSAGKPSKDRASHLASIKIPQLFVQGTHDALAKYELIREVIESCEKAELLTIEHANHSFSVARKYTQKSPEELIWEFCEQINNWILEQISH